MNRLIAVALIMLLYLTLPVAAFDTPRLMGRVNDHAGVLSKSEVASLSDLSSRIEATRESAPEVVVLTVDHLPADSTIESFSNQVFHDWGVGKRAHDNGVLIVLAVGDRKMRTEVGYGLEGLIPDAMASEVNEAMKPGLKQGRYAVAVEAGINRVASFLPTIGVSMSHEAAKPNLPAISADKSAEPLRGGVAVTTILVLIGLGCVVLGIILFCSSYAQSTDTIYHDRTTDRPNVPSSQTIQLSGNDGRRDEGSVAGAAVAGAVGATVGGIAASAVARANEEERRRELDWSREEEKRRRRIDDEEEERRRRRRRDEESSYGSTSSRSSSSDSSSSSGSSSSWGDSYSGGGGDSGGGGASDSW
jgi:uncharacterized protein